MTLSRGTKMWLLGTCRKRGMPSPTGTLTRARSSSSAVAVAQRDQQVQRQVGNERKRVRRIDALRRDQRVNVLEVITANGFAVGLVEVLVRLDVNALLAPVNRSVSGHQLVLLGLDFAHLVVAFLDLLAPAGGRRCCNP